jgi:uncharacterized protein (TIGR02147 family)
MTSVFDYIDFRAYLKNHYEEKRKEKPSFSYAVFARHAGLKNKGFIYQAINANKKLSHAHCYKLSKALGHTKEEAAYFENIVDFGLAKNNEDRDYFFKKALEFKKGATSPARLLRRDQYEYLSQWYHTAIRAIIALQPFKNDYARLARMLSPSISASQAIKSVRLLERLGLIVKGAGGYYQITEKKVKASDEISQTAKNRFHVEYHKLAEKSIMEHPPNVHFVSSMTLGISQRTYDLILRETGEFKERILDIASGDRKADRVYQYQLVFFPLTNQTSGEKGD